MYNECELEIKRIFVFISFICEQYLIFNVHFNFTLVLCINTIVIKYYISFHIRNQMVELLTNVDWVISLVMFTSVSKGGNNLSSFDFFKLHVIINDNMNPNKTNLYHFVSVVMYLDVGVT